MRPSVPTGSVGSAPPVSIVVSTLDRAPYLRRLLMSLCRLDYPAFEVVVVNGPSTDDTGAVLAEFEGRIKVVRCPDANLSRSRNIGIAAAAGEIVALIDDDALPANPDWLLRLAGALAENPRTGGVGGPVLHADTMEHEFEGRIASDYGVQLSPEEATRLGVAVDGRRWVRSVQGANCAFRREVLMAVGGFDEAFRYYFDETDVCLRVARAGHDIAYEPRSVVRHYQAPSSHRRARHDLNWGVMARSEMYFGLRNAADPLPRRMLMAVRLARRKPVLREIRRYQREGHYGTLGLVRNIAHWLGGTAGGAWLALTQPRRTPLGPHTPPPAPFLPFRGG